MVWFASDIWQIHPFCEGNTRATAVFMIKYMKTFGFKVKSDAFEKNSWYFRNALVRANYNDLQNGIHATTKFLEMFFSNLILGTEYELKNRYMHIDCVHDNSQSVIPKVPKSQIDTLECTLEELAVLRLIYKNPSIKQKELAAEIGRSLSTVKRIMESLQKKDYIRRVDGKRNLDSRNKSCIMIITEPTTPLIFMRNPVGLFIYGVFYVSISKTNINNTILKDKYGETLGWKDMSSEEMQKAWQNAKASDMLTICKDIECGDLPDLEMPKHIKDVLDFMKKTSVMVEGE